MGSGVFEVCFGAWHLAETYAWGLVMAGIWLQEPAAVPRHVCAIMMRCIAAHLFVAAALCLPGFWVTEGRWFSVIELLLLFGLCAGLFHRGSEVGFLAYRGALGSGR